MKQENQSMVTEFILTGFSGFPELQVPLFVVFSIIYVATLAGNIIIITTIRREASLHVPMYFFLSMLSCSEICYTLSIIPNTLVNLLKERATISFIGCAIQMYTFLTFAYINCVLLTVMAYDRYVSICKPLHYPVIMNQRFCNNMVVFSVATGFSIALFDSFFLFTLPYCGPNKINHFFCDMAPLVELACYRNYIGEIAIYLFCVLMIVLTFLLILLSYVLILNTILKIPTTAGKRKAFSTCASHLIVVVVHLGCASISHLRPQSRDTLTEDMFISLSYTLGTPLLNPVVYSLRNKDVQVALKKSLGHNACTLKR